MHRHEAGALKQHNKPFKSRHATKGELKANNKGRVPVTSVSSGSSGSQSRADRRNANKQKAQKARDALLMARRATATGVGAAPRLLGVVGLTTSVNVSQAASLLSENVTPLLGQEARRPGMPLHTNTQQKHALDIVAANTFQDALDLCKVADAILLVVHFEADSGRSESTPLLTAEAEAVITTLKAQGIPSPFVAMQGVNNLQPATPQRISTARAMLFSAMQHHLPDVAKPFPLDTAQDGATLLRMVMAPLTLKQLSWRLDIPYMLAESVTSETVTATDGTSKQNIGVSGFLRSMPLNPDRLVHITGLGTFQVERIEERKSPYRSHPRKGESTIQTEIVKVAVPDEKQESVATENVPDLTDQEQTWPTEEEMAEATKRKTKIRMVPEGTSEYQARWLVDEDEDEDEGEGEMDDDDMNDGEEANEDDDDIELGIPPELSKQFKQEKEKEDEKMEEAGEEDDDFGDFDEEDEEAAAQAAIEKEKALRKKLEEEDQEFPDEMEVPQTIPARVRFQKYRGLRSFRTTPWGPQAEYPLDYARLFTLANYKNMAKNAVRDAFDGEINAGSFVTVWLRVPQASGDEYEASPRVRAQVDAIRAWADSVAKGAFMLDHPLLLSGLRRHENRTSVVHFRVRRPSNEIYVNTAALASSRESMFAINNTDGEYETVKSRDLVTVDVGFRRYDARPAFSEVTPNGLVVSKKQKFLRFLPRVTGSGACCASVYGPVSDTSVPVMMWLRKPAENCDTLLCTGSFECADTERLLCKKVVLTALPYKIHRRTVVARGMFYNREDIEWFKPLQLVTKLGHTGEILEPVGTHGFMKCVFDNQLRQNDTICLNLYKRVFPKFP